MLGLWIYIDVHMLKMLLRYYSMWILLYSSRWISIKWSCSAMPKTNFGPLPDLINHYEGKKASHDQSYIPWPHKGYNSRFTSWQWLCLRDACLKLYKKTMVKVTRHVHVTVPIIIAKDKTLVILTYLFQNMLLKLLMKLYW